MNKVKFTKGKWVVVDGDNFSKEIEITTNGRLETSKGSICEMDIAFGGKHGIEQMANAHLIAVAPDMYKELSELAEWLKYREDCKLWSERVNNLLASARGEK